MAGAGPSNKNTGTLSEINVTPLVDVMLVLLVVFMITTPILVDSQRPRKVDVNLPKVDGETMEPGDDHFVLTLHKDFRITVQGDKGQIPVVDCSSVRDGNFGACLAELQTKLKANARVQKDRTVFLEADRALAYGFVVDVMSRVKGAGVERLGMVTDPPETESP